MIAIPRVIGDAANDGQRYASESATHGDPETFHVLRVGVRVTPSALVGHDWVGRPGANAQQSPSTLACQVANAVADAWTCGV